MKKIINIMFVLLMLVINISYIRASESIGTVRSYLRVRSEPNTNGNVLGFLDTGDEITILGSVPTTDTGACSSDWHHINYNNQKGYVCGSYISVITPPPNCETTVDEYEKSLCELGFPASYIPGLKAIHSKYPNWVFVPSNTGLDFETVIANEMPSGKSLVWYTYPEGYRSTNPVSYNYETDTFYRHPKEKSWWYAHEDVVRYYVDPRNFLDESHIFMFEDLSYNKNINYVTIVTNLLDNTFMKRVLPNYADSFILGGTTHNVSPAHMATRIIQEHGINGTVATTGEEVTHNGKTYKGLYNFYNVGASGSTTPALDGIVWANGGTNGTNKSYGRPWDTPEKSIIGGAEFLSKGYISQGQYTLYYQKWDVSPTSNTLYINQYMQNVMSPSSESVSTYNEYSKIEGLFNQELVFTIPIYQKMQETAYKLPKQGNPNNYLKSLKIDGKDLENFSNTTYNYTYNVPSYVSTIKVETETINSKTVVSGNGEIALNDRPITITVEAENGDKRIFNITVNKVDVEEITIKNILDHSGVKYNEALIFGIKNGTTPETLVTKMKTINPLAKIVVTDSNESVKTSAFGTGDKVIITSGSETETFEIIINGDTNGDSVVDLLDLLRIQKQLLNTITLKECYIKASDINGDSVVDLMDLLKVQKHILGVSVIE